MKIFLTGAEGFIGSHLTELLVRDGHDVKALIYYNSFNHHGWLETIDSDVKNQFELVMGDVRDSYQMQECISGVDAVIHLASLIGIPYSYHAPQSYVDTNVTGTLNVLQAAKNANVTRFLHTSTSEVYGTAQFVPMTETHPIQGQSPYSASKIAADQLAFSFFSSFDLPVTTLRPFNTYGPRQSLRAVIPNIITQVVNGVKDIKLGSVTPTRDFNFVSDTAAGFLAALKSEKGLGEVVNLGSNFEISISETVSLIGEIFDSEINTIEDEVRVRPEKSEVDRLWASNKKAKECFGWVPVYGNHNGFREGLIKTIEWFTIPENLAHYKNSGYVI